MAFGGGAPLLHPPPGGGEGPPRGGGGGWGGLSNKNLPLTRLASLATLSPLRGARESKSPLRQLQLDAAVAAIGFIRRRGVERLELAEAGGDETLRRDALADQVLH